MSKVFSFKNEITIKEPVELVFEYASDPENFPAWNYYVEQVERLSPEPLRVGARYHQQRREDEQVLEIAALEPGRSVTLRTVPPSKPELVREMTFKPRQGATEIVDRWELDLGIPGVIEMIAKRRVREAVRENLGKLKTLLETGQVMLQDGRIMRLGEQPASSS
jgi:uncharacterized membrane protein